MWCLWKARNDILFQRKDVSPFQIFFVAHAITNSLSLEVRTLKQRKITTENHMINSQEKENQRQGITIDSIMLPDSVKIYTNAAWHELRNFDTIESVRTGIGIFLQVHQRDQKMEATISATIEHSQSTIQAEAHGINLAAIIINMLNIQQAAILTDNLTLAKAAATRSPNSQPGHWQIRSILTNFCNNNATKQVQVFHIPRSHNCEAHVAAKLTQSQNIFPEQSFRISCCNVQHKKWHCPLIQIIADIANQGYVITHVNCR
ncbi:hypothetical protein VPH35_007941 [Triticum aestivum]